MKDSLLSIIADVLFLLGPKMDKRSYELRKNSSQRCVYVYGGTISMHDHNGERERNHPSICIVA